MHEEGKARDAALARALELKLSDRSSVTRRHEAVALSDDENIQVRTGYEFEGYLYGVRSICAEMLHHDGQHPQPQASIHRLSAVLGKVESGAADHHGQPLTRSNCHGTT